MEDLHITKILGGPANGQDVPSHWDTIATWEREGAPSFVYEERAYNVAENRYHVWVPFTVPDADTRAVIEWHAEMFRVELLSAQKELLREQMAAASQYTNVIMVVAYAALMTILNEFKDSFTPATAFAAALSLGVSLFAFVAWEVFTMIVRGNSMIRIAQAVNQPSRFATMITEYKERAGAFVNRFRWVWIGVMAVAVVAAVVSFGIMMSALVHGAWLEFMATGTCEISR